MLRNIIKIDEDKCNGCGLCAAACHEGAIGIIEGKARLLREDYCDGLGNCLPACPTGAITIDKREAPEFNEAAVKEKQMNKQGEELPCGCPGSRSKTLKHVVPKSCGAEERGKTESQLSQWPVQIKLAPVNAPYFKDCNLLIAADCTAYAFGDFHTRFMKNRVTLIGCTKLDDVDYSEKLTAIIRNNDIKSVTVVKMEVPCCGGMEHAVVTALKSSGKYIPWRVVTVSIDGQILED